MTTPSPTPQDDLEQQLSLAVFGKRTQELDLPVAERAYYVLPRLLRIISTREQKAHEYEILIAKNFVETAESLQDVRDDIRERIAELNAKREKP